MWICANKEKRLIHVSLARHIQYNPNNKILVIDGAQVDMSEEEYRALVSALEKRERVFVV